MNKEKVFPKSYIIGQARQRISNSINWIMALFTNEIQLDVQLYILLILSDVTRVRLLD